MQTGYDVTAFGAVPDGLVSSATQNTTAIQLAINAQSAKPGPIYFPPGLGYVVTNGKLVLSTPNAVLYGEASMGSVPAWGPTSTIIGHGPGHTLQITQGGCSFKGISIRANAPGEQRGTDAFLSITGTQVWVSDLFMSSPNVGVSMQLPSGAGGQFWLSNVLIGGTIGTSGVTINVGNAAVRLNHVRMFADNPQPPYGIVATCCGELIISDSDIDNCGTCLALVPGLNGVPNQNVSAVMVANSYFDNGNGPGLVFVQPQGNGFAQNIKFSNVWTSTINNNGGAWSTDGFHFDGTKSVPPAGVRPVTDVGMTNCHGQNFLQHDALYAVGVTGLSVLGFTGGGSFNGIQVGGALPSMACSGIVAGSKVGNYVSPPLGSPLPLSGGNAQFGILVQKSPLMKVSADNCWDGNGKGGYVYLP